MRAVNLIPADQRGGSSVGAGRSEGGAYAVLALVAGLAVMALLYGMAKHQASSRRAQAASITAQVQSAKSAAEALAPYTSFISLRQQRTQAVADLVGARFDWAHVFHEFGRVLPAEVSISSLTGTVGGSASSSTSAPVPAPSTPAAPGASASGAEGAASVTSATPPGSVPSFSLTGCATSQPAVARMLERLRLIDGVSDVKLQSSTKGSSSGGSSGGGCSASGPAFTVEITFDPLPTPTATAPSTKVVSNSTAAPTTTGGIAR